MKVVNTRTALSQPEAALARFFSKRLIAQRLIYTLDRNKQSQ